MAKYVVWWQEHLQDSSWEDASKVVDTLGAAEKVINEVRSGFSKGNCYFKVFELGKEIEIVEEETRMPQPDIVKTIIKIKKDN